MIRTRLWATLAVAVLSLVARTSDAAIITFGQSFLLGSTVQFTQNLDSGTIDAGFPKAQSVSPVGLYELGDPEVMFYDVGFRGDIDTMLGGGNLLIGQSVSFTGGAGDVLSAAISNDNNTPWVFGLWYQYDSNIVDANNNIVLSLPVPLIQDTQSVPPTPFLSVAGVNVIKAGFYVALSGGKDAYHVSLQATEGADVILLPEPASMLVWGLGMGVIGAVGCYRRRRLAA